MHILCVNFVYVFLGAISLAATFYAYVCVNFLNNLFGCFFLMHICLIIFIGPRYPWSDLCVRMSVRTTPCVDLTDVTLADEDTNPILTDSANRAIQGNVAMQ